MRRSGVGSMGTRLGVVLSAWLAGLHALMAFAGPPFVVASDFFIGGTGHDRVTDLVVDAAGNVLVAGVIRSFNFPGIDSAAVTNGGMDLRFVARIPPLSRSASLVAVVGAPTAALADAHLSKFGADEAAGLAVDASGNAYLVAYDGSRDYPIVGGQYQGTTGRKYVFKVSASGAVGKLSNALDPAINRVGGIAVDKAGAIYLTGSARDGLQTTAGRALSHEQRGGGLHRALRDEARRYRPDRSLRDLSRQFRNAGVDLRRQRSPDKHPRDQSPSHRSRHCGRRQRKCLRHRTGGAGIAGDSGCARFRHEGHRTHRLQQPGNGPRFPRFRIEGQSRRYGDCLHRPSGWLAARSRHQHRRRPFRSRDRRGQDKLAGLSLQH